MKKRIPVVMAGLLLLFTIGSAAAYLTDADYAINTTIPGDNTIDAEETFDPPSPGSKTVKNPKARNTGAVDCYVRAKVLISDHEAEEYLMFYNNSTIGMNSGEWITREDGWMYYHQILPVGEVTSPVFTHIYLESDIPEELNGFTVDVVFESVQIKGHSDPISAFDSIETK